jgi:hypothetical protein
MTKTVKIEGNEYVVSEATYQEIVQDDKKLNVDKMRSDILKSFSSICVQYASSISPHFGKKPLHSSISFNKTEDLGIITCHVPICNTEWMCEIYDAIKHVREKYYSDCIFYTYPEVVDRQMQILVRKK